MPEHIETIALHETARERYLNYALSVITSRALPDIRDGLKPVQRRILYGMHHGLRLTHDARYRKSAAVVGEVMAKYHPHGDQAIYDAMVRLAQSFSLRYPLVDGQGNFGSLDGDGAAAMRYTEARLRPIADEFMSEIGKRTVPFRSNYDGQTQEPCVLPAQVPNLLINGATGIAVGMATHVPPHNLREVVKALIRLIDHPDSELDDILKLIKGPDFPTGGRLLNTGKELRAIYATGRGALKIVAEYNVEPSEDDDGNDLLVITSIPFGSDKTEILEKIAEHIQNSGLPQLLDVRDESTDTVRIVCEMAPLKSKTTAQECADLVMAYLYKHTGLLNRFHVNLTCLVPATSPLALTTQREREDIAAAIPLHTTDRLEIALDDATLPAQVGLMDLLGHFLDFRFAVVTRRLRFDLERLNARIHTLRGFALIFDALDEALGLIREAEGRADAADKLIARFGLDHDQVDAILQTRLYKLARLEIDAIRKELAECLEQAAAIQKTLDSDEAIWELIKDELRTLSRKYGDKRRTPIGEVEEAALEYSAEDYIVSEDAAAIITREGWIKRQRSYRDLSAIRVRDNDEVGWALRASTRATVIFFSDRGQAYTMLVDQFPATSGYGEPLQAHFDFEDGERIVGVSCTDPRFEQVIPGNIKAPMLEHTPAPPYVLALTRSGNAVRLPRLLFDEPSNRTGRRYIRLLDAAPDGKPDRVIKVLNCAGDEMLCVASVLGRGVAFSIQEATLLRGPGRGVNTLNLQDGDTLLDASLVAHTDKYNGLQVRKPSGKIEKVSPSRFLVGRRNAKGRAIIKRGRLEALPPTPVEVRDDDDDPDPAPRRATHAPAPSPKPRASPATEREQDPNQGHLFS